MNAMKKTISRLLSTVLAAMLVLVLIPVQKVQAATGPDYSLFLTSDGKVKINGETGDEITVDGISFENGVYTFNNVRFTTSSHTALLVQTDVDVTIKVEGTNSFKSTYCGQESTYGLFSTSRVNLEGTGTISFVAGKSLNLNDETTSAGINAKSLYLKDCTVEAKSSGAVYKSAGILFPYACSNLMIDNARLKVTAGNIEECAPQINFGIFFQNADPDTEHSLTIINGTLDITGGNASEEAFALIASKLNVAMRDGSLLRLSAGLNGTEKSAIKIYANSKVDLDSSSAIQIAAGNSLSLKNQLRSYYKVSSNNTTCESINDGSGFNLTNNTNGIITLIKNDSTDAGTVNDYDDHATGSISVSFENKSSYYLSVPTNTNLSEAISNGAVEKSLTIDGQEKAYKILQTNLGVSVHDGSLLYTDKVRVTVACDGVAGADGVLKYGARKVNYKLLQDNNPNETIASNKNYTEYTPFDVYWSNAEKTSATTEIGKNKMELDLAILSGDYDALTQTAAEYKTKVVFSASIDANCIKNATESYKIALADTCLDKQAYQVADLTDLIDGNGPWRVSPASNSYKTALNMMNVGDILIYQANEYVYEVKYCFVERTSTSLYDVNGQSAKTWNEIKNNADIKMIYYCAENWY